MISREWAIEVVERELRAQAAVSPESAVVVIDVKAHELGWLVTCQPPAYARSHDVRDMFIGDGPFLVDALDGSLHMVHRQFCVDGLEWPDQYREKVRGEIPPRELDVEVHRLCALGRRADAYRAVRRAGGGLSPADALRYVDAVAAGAEPPADLLSRLPQRDTSYPSITTYSGPNPEPAQPLR